jgi:hypothetical membrane protein
MKILAGIVSLSIALMTIALCWALNPWFDFWKDAFSDFGVEKARFPWLYNGGLILSSIFLMLYSIGIYEASSHKLEALSSGLLITASIFLALIGLFPGGTEPHNFVSTWFFLQSFFGFSVLGVAISLKGDRIRGLLISIPSALSPIVALAIDLTSGWPSAAVAEASGISVLALSLFSSISHYLGRRKRPSSEAP